MTDSTSFRATKLQIALLIGAGLFFLLPMTVLIHFDIMTIPLSAFALLIAIVLIGRAIAIIRFPVAEIRENQLDVYTWFGFRRRFDLTRPIDFSVGTYGIVLKQGRTGAGFGREVLSRSQFEEFISYLDAVSSNGSS